MKNWFRTMVALGLVVSLGSGINRAAAAPGQQSARIEYNETVRGEVSETAGEDSWEFEGHAGELVLIDMRADGSDLDPYLTLLDPFGNPLSTDDDSGEGINARIGPYRLPDDGIYTILAGRYGGAGRYLLELKNLSTIPTLIPSKPLIGVVNSTHPTDYFLLATGDTDQLWRLVVSDDQSDSDPILSLYGTSGLLFTTEAAGGSRIDPVVSLDGETYTAVVSWNPYSPGGPYQLDLDASDIELLGGGLSQTGTLDASVTECLHYFRAEKGQIVRLSASVEGEIVLALEVMTLNGSRFLFSNSGETLRALTVTLDIPETGVYIARLWDGAYLGRQGSYTISLTGGED